MLRLVVVSALLCAPLFSQSQPCNLSPIQVHPAKGNFFTEQQENQLGDIVAEEFAQEFTVVHNDALSAHLREVGEKIVAQLPTKMSFHFEIMEYPEANAFSLPGGRIYVSRKVIALAKSEDELAALLAHELGHEVTHQSAAVIAREFHQLFGINQVSSADEIRQRYNQRLDKRAKINIRVPDEEDDQVEADSVAVQAMARAGYNPAAFGTLFDRLAETRGGKSNFFSDFFGTTPADVSRYRKLAHMIATIPPGCASQHSPLEAFNKWQADVIAYDVETAVGSPALLPGLLAERKLDPALRPDIQFIRYSHDGKYLLVQDSGAIEILTRDPFAAYMQIPATNGRRAQFSTDGQTVSFFVGTTDPRVETWNIARKKRVSLHELHMKHECVQALLSPDGNFFACVTTDSIYNLYSEGLKFGFAFYDVATGAEVFHEADMTDTYGANAVFWALEIVLGDIKDPDLDNIIFMKFSPDGRYFVAARGTKVVAYDLSRRSFISLPGPLKERLCNNFFFLSTDRILDSKDLHWATSEIRSFPDGKVLKEGISTRGGWIAPTDDPNFAILHLDVTKDYKALILDLQQNKFVVGLKNGVAGVRDGEFAMEQTDGEIAIHPVDDPRTKDDIELPQSRIGGVHFAAASPDLRWVALSDHTRGGVWDLATGTRRFHLRGFEGAFFSRGFLHAEMLKFQDAPHAIVHMQLEGNKMLQDELTGNDLSEQYGPVVLVFKGDPNKKIDLSKMSHGNAIHSMKNLEVHDANTQKLLWAHDFPKSPETMFVHPETDSIAFFSKDRDNVVLEFHQLSDGNTIVTLPINTNKHSFRVDYAYAAGDFIIVTDNEHRVTVYSKSGQQIERVFGSTPAVAVSEGVLAVTTDDQQLTFYELATMHKVQTLTFPQEHFYYQFDKTGKKLLVLTVDQMARIFDVDKLKASPSAGGN